MKQLLEQKMKVIATLILGAALLVGFQNCSGPLDFSALEQKSANGNGTGYDGKVTYVNHGRCPNLNMAPLQVKGVINVAADGSAEIVRQDCLDLPLPLPIATSSMRMTLTDPTVFVHNREIYDLRVDDPSQRKLTRLICWAQVNAATHEMMTWYYGDAMVMNSGPLTMSGVFFSTSAETTGVLNPVSESYASTIAKVTMGASSGANAFSITANSTASMVYANYTFTIGGVTSGTKSATDCYLQAPNFINP